MPRPSPPPPITDPYDKTRALTELANALAAVGEVDRAHHLAARTEDCTVGVDRGRW